MNEIPFSNLTLHILGALSRSAIGAKLTIEYVSRILQLFSILSYNISRLFSTLDELNIYRSDAAKILLLGLASYNFELSTLIFHNYREVVRPHSIKHFFFFFNSGC